IGSAMTGTLHAGADTSVASIRSRTSGTHRRMRRAGGSPRRRDIQSRRDHPMTLPSGTRLGPYVILSPLGAGGMGEVYRASDAKLRLEVAIKVLPEAVAQDHARLARFEREAQLLASLNHPNIGTIYGVEDSGGAPALVMELVEGPTL